MSDLSDDDGLKTIVQFHLQTIYILWCKQEKQSLHFTQKVRDEK